MEPTQQPPAGGRAREVRFDSAEAQAAYRAGLSAGYTEAMTFLDDAGAILAGLKPSRALDHAAARERRDTYTTPALSAEEIREQAYASWGLQDPRKATEAEPAADDETTDGAQVAQRQTHQLILDLNLGNPERLRWAAGECDAMAAQLRTGGDLAGAVEYQVRAEKHRADAAALSRPHHSASSSSAPRGVAGRASAPVQPEPEHDDWQATPAADLDNVTAIDPDDLAGGTDLTDSDVLASDLASG